MHTMKFWPVFLMETPGGGSGGGEPAAAGGEGAGAAQTETNGNGLYDLASAPDELRPYIEAELKKIEGNVTKRFEQFAPLKALGDIEGLTDIAPEQLSELVAFHQLVQDPEQFKEWWQQIGEHLGFTEGDDDDDELDLGLEPEVDIERKVNELLEQRLAPFQQQMESQQQEALVAQARQEIEGKFKELHDQHGDFDEEAVAQLAWAYEGADDAIDRGFADYQRIVGAAEKGAFSARADTSGGERGGGPAAPEAPTTFEAANEAALARMKAMNAA